MLYCTLNLKHDTMERLITFTPAFDERNSDPKKNYGIHGVDMYFVLKGELGAISFTLFTNWHLPHVQKELEAKPSPAMMFKPSPADISIHSHTPLFEGHNPVGVTTTYDDDFNPIGTEGEPSPCKWLNDKPCYCDGSALAAEKVFNALVAEGEDALWKELENWYESNFGELK
jgi:hypothetical protein